MRTKRVGAFVIEALGLNYPTLRPCQWTGPWGVMPTKKTTPIVSCINSKKWYIQPFNKLPTRMKQCMQGSCTATDYNN